MSLARPTPFRPTLDADATARLLDAGISLAGLAPDAQEAHQRVLEGALKGVVGGSARTRLEASVRVLIDLRSQGWEIALDPERNSSGLTVQVPSVGADDERERQRIRRQEELQRDQQLKKDAVRTFVQTMETARRFLGRATSVFDLMCDGRDLLERLDGGPASGRPLRPYVQVVTPEATCAHTGLRLMDIWRYFRHTWANPYASVPGRTLSFLVRDAAHPRHAVMGLFSLASPVVQISVRDRHLGWHPNAVLQKLEGDGDVELARALLSTLQRTQDELYVADLVAREGGTIAPRALLQPSDSDVRALEELSRRARRDHNKHRDHHLLRAELPEESGWVGRATTSLFLSKRAALLAELLSARLALSDLLAGTLTPERVRAAARSPRSAQALRRLARRSKAERVGTALADLSVCGAIAPYNHLLGGKLVAMLAASPASVDAYRQRYSGAVSEIASAMAGEEIVRPAELAFIGTTSLYGVSLNQYTRAGYPCDLLGGRGHVRYESLGRSMAYGHSHYSDATIELLSQLADAGAGFRRVNNIFGEGTSPRLRRLRAGLDALGLPHSRLMQHTRHRVVYGVELLENTRSYLLGMDETPRYRFPLEHPEVSTERIADYWWERWVSPRLKRPELRARVAQEALSRPVRHAARIRLPPETPAEPSLFEDLW